MMTIQQLMQQLRAEELVTADKQAEIEAILSEQEAGTHQAQTSTPWYIHVLMGLAAWLGASFMLTFLMALISDSDITMLITGLLLCTAGVALRSRLLDALKRISLVASDKSGGVQLHVVGAQFTPTSCASSP